jgi:hypothetical protein
VSAPLVEVLAAQPNRHDVECLDVAQGGPRLGQRGANRIVGARGRAADELDDLGNRYGST